MLTLPARSTAERCLHNDGFWLVSGMLAETDQRYVLGTAKTIARKVCR